MSRLMGSSRLLAVAAVVLVVVGLVLVMTGSDDDGGSSGSAGVATEDQPGGDAPADGDIAGPGVDGAGDDGDTPDGDGDTPDADPGADGRPDDADNTEDPGDTQEPLAPSDTPTAAQTPAPRQTPTLPPGMQLPEPVHVPEAGDVDGGDATAVVAAALTAAYSFDTAQDASAQDAMVRTQVWLTDDYDASAYDLQGLEQDVHRDWPAWSEHQAFASISAIEPQTTDVDTPDTATRAERRFYVRVTPVGRDAWNGSLMVHQWFAFLVRDSAEDEWRIAELQTPLAHR